MGDQPEGDNNSQEQERLQLTKQDKPSAAPRRSNMLGWIAILLSIIAIILVAIAWEQASRANARASNVTQEVTNLNAQIDTINSDVSKKTDTSDVQQQITALAKQLTDLSTHHSSSSSVTIQDVAAINTKLESLQQTQSGLQQTINQQQNILNKLQSQQNPSAPNSKAALLQVLAWVQNAEISLRLNHAVKPAILYLQSADQLLKTKQSRTAAQLRQQIQSDTEKLQAVKAPDTDNILSRLNQLSTVVSKLSIVPPKDWRPGETYAANSQSAVKDESAQTDADANANTDANSEDKGTWHSIRSSLSGLKKLFVFRKVKDSENAKLQPGQLNLIRSNIVQKIQQAAWGALHHSQSVYQASLQSAKSQISRNFLFDRTQTKEIIRDIDQLLAVKVDPEVPDLQSTIQSIKQALAAPSSAPTQQMMPSVSSSPAKQLKKQPVSPAAPKSRKRRITPPSTKAPITNQEAAPKRDDYNKSTMI